MLGNVSARIGTALEKLTVCGEANGERESARRDNFERNEKELTSNSRQNRKPHLVLDNGEPIHVDHN